MTQQPQPLDLDAIEQRTNAATPGPWRADGFTVAGGGAWVADTCDVVDMAHGLADAEFIAAARTDVPALLAEVRRLTAELAAEQRAHGETINELDHTVDMADKLAQMIATEDMVGEHTGMNDPWQNTLDLWKDLTSEGSISLAGEIRRLRAELATMTAVAESNKRYVQSMYQDLQQAQQQVAAVELVPVRRREDGREYLAADDVRAALGATIPQSVACPCCNPANGTGLTAQCACGLPGTDLNARRAALPGA